MPALTFGTALALLVVVCCLVLALIGQLALVPALLIGATALSRIVP